MKKRQCKLSRNTYETKIEISLDIDGSGKNKINTGIPFFDHMLQQISKHGHMDLELLADGDIQVDYHHTVEDVGILLGKAIFDALGDKEGIVRYATIFTPMDEALSMASMDISGRPFLYFDVGFTGERTGDFEVQLVEEFFRAVAFNSGMTLHIKTLHGRNDHHIIETIFKSFGRALDAASGIDPRIDGVLSTKGIL